MFEEQDSKAAPLHFHREHATLDWDCSGGSGSGIAGVIGSGVECHLARPERRAEPRAPNQEFPTE